VGLAYLRRIHPKPPAVVDAFAKVCAGHGSHARADVRVGQDHVGVREHRLPPAYTQRPYKATIEVVHVNDVDIGDVHHMHAVEAKSPPGEERIKRTHRAPANVAETKADVRSEPEEEHKRRRP
jgi:hypothetical protein